MARNRKHAAAHRGFSLVELILVVVIIGVVSAVALPRFSQAARSQRLDKAADRVVADLELAKSRARAASQDVTVTFNVSDGSYKIPAVAGAAIDVELSEVPYEIPIGSADFDGDPFVTFNAYGVPHSAGTIVVGSSSGEHVKVLISASGEVTR